MSRIIYSNVLCRKCNKPLKYRNLSTEGCIWAMELGQALVYCPKCKFLPTRKEFMHLIKTSEE